VLEWSASDGWVVDSAVLGMDRVTNTAICAACGYPTVRPGLCALCQQYPGL